MAKVSVVIPTTDKEKDIIKKSLAHLERSIYKDFEIIVVNEGRERSYQRNFGIKKATGKYILYLDADQFVSPELIGECVRLAEVGFSAVYIREKIITKGFFGYLRNWERQFYTGTPIDCVRFFRKQGCPLFDESLNGPEDSDHDRRVKGFRAVTNNYLYHEDNVSFTNYLKKKAYYAKSMKKFADNNPGDKVLSFWWRCFGVFFEGGKWKKVIRRPDLFLCVMGIIFLRGIIYVTKR